MPIVTAICCLWFVNCFGFSIKRNVGIKSTLQEVGPGGQKRCDTYLCESNATLMQMQHCSLLLVHAVTWVVDRV